MTNNLLKLKKRIEKVNPIIKIGDTNIAVCGVTSDHVIFGITSNCVGFETMVKLDNDMISRLVGIIKDARCVDKHIYQNTINCVTAKQHNTQSVITNQNSPIKFIHQAIAK